MERIREKTDLKIIPLFIRLTTFRSSEWKRVEYILRVAEIPRSLRAIRKEGAIKAKVYMP